jgi:hypothetical protein
MSYSRFFAMIATSTVVMFCLMYLNTYVVDHVFWSETRVYMAVVMGATMAFIMLAFMLSMYASHGLNIAIFAGSIAVFAVALWLVRSQTTVEDRSYMSAMIPHHSIAIMTSTRANISDPRVRKLADGIIYAQDKEIAEMRYLIADIAANGDASDDKAESAARQADAREALSTEVLATIDPEFLKEDEIANIFPEGAACRYAYAEKSPPVLSWATRLTVWLGSSKSAATWSSCQRKMQRAKAALSKQNLSWPNCAKAAMVTSTIWL